MFWNDPSYKKSYRCPYPCKISYRTYPYMSNTNSMISYLILCNYSQKQYNINFKFNCCRIFILLIMTWNPYLDIFYCCRSPTPHYSLYRTDQVARELGYHMIDVCFSIHRCTWRNKNPRIPKLTNVRLQI